MCWNEIKSTKVEYVSMKRPKDIYEILNNKNKYKKKPRICHQEKVLVLIDLIHTMIMFPKMILRIIHDIFDEL